MSDTPSEKYVSEAELNQRAVAPRVTQESLEANIVAENYINVGKAIDAAGQPSNERHHLMTICVLTLANGFTVTGHSSCASAENYQEDIGNRIARGDAVRQVWALMGYELRSILTRQESTDDVQLFAGDVA